MTVIAYIIAYALGALSGIFCLALAQMASTDDDDDF